MNRFTSLIDRFDRWVAERDNIGRNEPHSRRAWASSDDDGIELLRDMTTALRALNEQPCGNGSICLHCGGRLTWLDTSRADQTSTPPGWTEQCSQSPDRQHHPNDGEPRTLGALAAGQELRLDPRLAAPRREKP